MQKTAVGLDEMSGLVPAGHQNGLVSREALPVDLDGDVGQHVPAA